MSLKEESPGFTATIHQSLLEDLLFWPGVPFQGAIAVMVSTLLSILVFGLMWPELLFRLPVVGVVEYLGLYFLTRRDAKRFVHLFKYLSYPSYMGVD